MKRRTLMWVVVSIVIAGLLATALGVYAQPPPGGGAPGGGPGGPPGGGQWRGMMGGMSQGVAIAVSGESVFVVYMGTLFRFNVDTLEEEAQVRLRPQGMGPGGPGGGGMPGFGAPPGPAAPPGAAPANPPPAGQE